MLSKWLRFIFWKPLEVYFKYQPLIPLNIIVNEVYPKIKTIRFKNLILNFLVWFSGGYDYSIIILVDDELVYDSGFAWSRNSLKKYIVENNLNQTIKTVINSHFHEDHIGNNELLVNLCNAKVFAHKESLSQISFIEDKEFYRHFLFGNYQPVKVNSCLNEYQTSNYIFQVINTPGHTPGHICLYEPNHKIFFSGDLFIDASLSSQLAEVDGPSWIKSLEDVLNLDIELLIDGHGLIIKGKNKVKEALKRKLDFLVDLQNRILKLSKDYRSISKITQKVFPHKNFLNFISFNEGWMSFITGGSFSRSNLVRSFLK